jgi:PPOX class probable FMN-dependent enzyme
VIVDPHRVASHDDLVELLGEPGGLVRSKIIGRLDGHCRGFIARSPFALLGTVGGDGRLDVSPRGGNAGFAEVSDDGGTLIFGDAKGNRLADSLRNIVETRRAGMLFLLPGFGETLRVNGRAHLTRDPAVLERHVGTGSRPPKLAVVVEVEEAFLHCAAAMLRSSLWKPETWPDLDGLASPARIWKDHAAAPQPVEELEIELADGYANDRDW